MKVSVVVAPKCEGVTYLDFWTSLHPPTNHCHAPIVIVMLCSALCFPTKLYVQVLNDSSIFVFRREYLLGIHDAHSFIPYSTKSSEVNFSLSVSQFSFQVIFLICVCVVLRGFHYWETIRATAYLFCIRRTLAGHLRLMLMTCCCCCCSNSIYFHTIYSFMDRGFAQKASSSETFSFFTLNSCMLTVMVMIHQS